MIVIVTMIIVMIMIACWSEHLQYGTRGHRSYNINNADSGSSDAEAEQRMFSFGGTTGFVGQTAASASQEPDCSKIRSLPAWATLGRTVVMKTPSTATPRPPQRRCRSSYVSSRQHVQPVYSSEQTVLLINQSKGCWNIQQVWEFIQEAWLWKSSYSTWNQPFWEYVHSTTIQE